MNRIINKKELFSFSKTTRGRWWLALFFLLAIALITACGSGKKPEAEHQEEAPAGPEWQVHRPRQDLADGDDQRRPPGLLERGDRRDLQHVPDPTDVRAGGPGQDDARRGCARGGAADEADFRQVEEAQEDLGTR